MFEKIMKVHPLNNYILEATFQDGSIRIFDMKSEIESKSYYAPLKQDPELFGKVRPTETGSAVFWTDEIDMASEWIWDHGDEINSKNKQIIDNPIS